MRTFCATPINRGYTSGDRRSRVYTEERNGRRCEYEKRIGRKIGEQMNFDLPKLPTIQRPCSTPLKNQIEKCNLKEHCKMSLLGLEAKF
uniref:Uncharacterized protein n=1 Tax=Caenorhabditis tropicalis TaxID=1561998 RepID=A0A1I7UQG3_9PELO